jgi:hypothetical protein
MPASWEFPYECSVSVVTDAPVAPSTIASNPEIRGGSATVWMDIQDRTPDAVFARYGLELRAPAEAYCATSDLSNFGNGYVVTRGSYKYHVAAVVMAREEDADLAYGCVLLDRVLI